MLDRLQKSWKRIEASPCKTFPGLWEWKIKIGVVLTVDGGSA
jgi:hypothetical protein